MSILQVIWLTLMLLKMPEVSKGLLMRWLRMSTTKSNSLGCNDSNPLMDNDIMSMIDRSHTLSE